MPAADPNAREVYYRYVFLLIEEFFMTNLFRILV